MCAKAVDNWPRYDPRTGLMLCEGCWNNQNWSHRCTKGACACPKSSCAGEPKIQKVKFTGEGQIKIDVGDDVIRVGPHD